MINYHCGGFNYTYHILSRRQGRKCCGEGILRVMVDGLPLWVLGLIIIMGNWIMNGTNSETVHPPLWWGEMSGSE
jgi:hypothetical protein